MFSNSRYNLFTHAIQDLLQVLPRQGLIPVQRDRLRRMRYIFTWWWLTLTDPRDAQAFQPHLWARWTFSSHDGVWRLKYKMVELKTTDSCNYLIIGDTDYQPKRFVITTQCPSSTIYRTGKAECSLGRQGHCRRWWCSPGEIYAAARWEIIIFFK